MTLLLFVVPGFSAFLIITVPWPSSPIYIALRCLRVKWSTRTEVLSLIIFLIIAIPIALLIIATISFRPTWSFSRRKTLKRQKRTRSNDLLVNAYTLYTNLIYMPLLHLHIYINRIINSGANTRIFINKNDPYKHTHTHT